MRNILAERSVKGGNPQMMRRAVNRSSKLNDAVVTKVKRFLRGSGIGSDEYKLPHGEPYAGKLHVRFDEGAGAPHGGVPLYSTPLSNCRAVRSGENDIISRCQAEVVINCQT